MALYKSQRGIDLYNGGCDLISKVTRGRGPSIEDHRSRDASTTFKPYATQLPGLAEGEAAPFGGGCCWGRRNQIWGGQGLDGATPCQTDDKPASTRAKNQILSRSIDTYTERGLIQLNLSLLLSPNPPRPPLSCQNAHHAKRRARGFGHSEEKKKAPGDSPFRGSNARAVSTQQ
ncbi:hypothetical protein NL676_014695 [Syzygium grande]|nr:hypothetical protein NL676_014695 [Syzygium grande]